MPNAHGVVAVYKDEASAQRVATALRSMGVVPSTEIARFRVAFAVFSGSLGTKGSTTSDRTE